MSIEYGLGFYIKEELWGLCCIYGGRRETKAMAFPKPECPTGGDEVIDVFPNKEMSC